jgi:hypothetical protein
VLVELTAANELDLAMLNPELANAFGSQVLELLRGARGRLSEHAWRACAGTLEEH